MSGHLLVLATVIGCLSAQSIVPKASTDGENPGQNVLALPGHANCGTGGIIDVRLSGCNSAPCSLRRGQSYNLAVDFMPTGTRDFGTVYYKSIALKDNQIQTVNSDVHLPGVHLRPGIIYTFTHDIVIPNGGFTGNDSELRVKVYQNFQKPLCLIIPATFQ